MALKSSQWPERLTGEGRDNLSIRSPSLAVIGWAGADLGTLWAWWFVELKVTGKEIKVNFYFTVELSPQMKFLDTCPVSAFLLSSE